MPLGPDPGVHSTHGFGVITQLARVAPETWGLGKQKTSPGSVEQNICSAGLLHPCVLMIMIDEYVILFGL
jgi:hypothetical protein